jgi:DNA-binding NarL/FixJ family response regulator
MAFTMTISHFEKLDQAPVAFPPLRFPAVSPKQATGNVVRTVRFALAFRRPLDLAAYAALINEMPGVRVVAADADLAACLAQCRMVSADAALLDATYPRLTAFEAAQSLLSRGEVRTVAFLDDQFAIVRAERAIAIPNSIYLTRANELAPVFRELCERLEASCDFPGRAVLSTGARGLKFAQSLEDLRCLDHTGFLSLTSREREIVERLAVGMSLKEIAHQLGVAFKTIDNHKGRLMKKLKLHRHPQIASLALQAGLMDYPEYCPPHRPT